MKRFAQAACPLCGHLSDWFFKSARGGQFFQCRCCRGIHVPNAFWLATQGQKEHYLTHNNDVFDPRYRSFVSPVVEAILNEQSASALGLDYGAGPGPVISHMLAEQGFQTRLFDPFFHPDTSTLNDRYDYVICTEVIEHFQQPNAEFTRLTKLLKPNGTLYCTTELYHEGIDFAKWRYKNDPTHVFYYQSSTIHWIAKELGFATPEIEGRRIILRKRDRLAF